MTTLGALYMETRKNLRDISSTPDLDARLLISYAMGCAPDDVILKPDMPVIANASLNNAIARRLKSEPVSKITGTREFYGLVFDVTPDVLDPRPDTETLVDAARKYMKRGGGRILDLCTGSGCILTALMTLCPDATGVAADISDAALNVARSNFRRHGVADRIETIKSDYLAQVPGTFDLIVCNPPYIESQAIPSLEPDVRLYDPIIALDGGDDGLTPYRIVFPQIRERLNEGGAALFEIGSAQGPDIARLAETTGLKVISRIHDYGDRERVVVLG